MSDSCAAMTKPIAHVRRQLLPTGLSLPHFTGETLFADEHWHRAAGEYAHGLAA